jgi:CDP-glucose 4,6-dehydratase
MAAQPLVRRSYTDPVETYSTNVMGLVNLFEAVRATESVKAVLNVTSDKCYENREWIWGYREHDPMGGHDPYSNSKACAELVTSAYRQSFFSAKANSRSVAVASARAGNVVGGGDWSDSRLVPDILKALSEGRPAEIRNPSSVRPWQHVLEPLSGYLNLAERLLVDGEAFAEGWNFGPFLHESYPVSDIATMLTMRWGNGARWEAVHNSGPHEAGLLSLDCTKAHHRLNWTPRWTVVETVDRIVAWQRAYEADADMHQFTLDQIAAYGGQGE